MDIASILKLKATALQGTAADRTQPVLPPACATAVVPALPVHAPAGAMPAPCNAPASISITHPSPITSHQSPSLPVPSTHHPSPITHHQSPTTLATLAPPPIQPSPAEERLARAKAEFVCEVRALAARDRVTIDMAAATVALQNERYAALRNAGKRGESLIGGHRAARNYRVWLADLTRDGAALDPSAWRKLLPKFRGARPYVRPGADAFWQLLANLYEHPNKLSLRYAYSLAAKTMASHGSAGILPASPALSIASYDQVKHYYDRHADQKAVLIARNGEDFFRNNIAGHITREAPLPDECWVGDHHILDLYVRIPDGKGGWKPCRPWLTAWLDWGSLFFVGWQLRDEAPNRDPIERSLRAAIASNQLHPPSSLYIDNGKDYKAKGFTRPYTDDELARQRSICESLNVAVHFAIPYNARAKIIERCFGNVAAQFSKLSKAYCGSSPNTRPGEAKFHWTHPEQLQTLEECAATFSKWLTLIYHGEPSNGETLKGKTPSEIRAGMKHPRPAFSQDSFYKAFLRPLGARAIRRGGCVLANGREYYSADLYRIMDGKAEVLLRMDPDDVDTVWCYTLDGREICAASAKVTVPGLIDKDDATSVELLRAQQRLHAGQLRDARAASADRRSLSAFRRTPDMPAHLLGNGVTSAPIATAIPERRAAAFARNTPVSDPALVAEIDEMLASERLELAGSAMPIYQDAVPF